MSNIADDKPRTLLREELYELAWSKSRTSLAKDFGISDVALAKRCRRLKIPIPGRGYWARVEAGQRPPRPKLAPRESHWRDYQALSLGRFPHARMPVTPEEKNLDPVAAKIAILELEPPVPFAEMLPEVKRTALHLKCPRRNELKFDRDERRGPLVPIEVTPEASERALFLADRLLRAAAALGWQFIASSSEKALQETRTEVRYNRDTPAEPAPSPPPPEGRLIVESEEVEIRIEERFREEPRTPTAAELAREKREYRYQAPRTVSVATGHLRVARLNTYRPYFGPPRRSWYDRKATPVEDQIRDILLGCYEVALSMRERRTKDEEEARQRADAERVRQERIARQEANAALIRQLETDAGAWHRAQYLRRYLRAARRQLSGEMIPARYLKEVIDFIEWAERYVEQLDPLSFAPRLKDYERPSNDYGSDEEKWKKGLARLTGAPWREAWKRGFDYAQLTASRNSWDSERSVFEMASNHREDETDE